MERFIELFHIDIKLLIAQVINFSIVLVSLWFFALKPLMKIMKQRTQTIEKCLVNAKKIEQNLADSKKDYTEHLNRAREEANKILEAAQVDAQNQKKELLTKAKSEIEKLVKNAKSQIREERNQMLDEAKKEVIDIVKLSLEKILGKTLSPELDNTFILETLSKIKVEK